MIDAVNPFFEGSVMNIQRLLLTMLATGMAYYGGAWLSVTHTITPEGIAILWLPNAILLPVFLLRPYREWPFLALAALAAEILADLPAFPLWACIAFGAINLLEVSLAAVLMRRVAGDGFNFDRLRNGTYFLLFGPVIASSLAGTLGAGIYLLLGRTDTSYLELWQLWWFGDALGLLLLTPLIVTLWRAAETGLQPLPWKALAEAAALWLVVIGFGFFAFTPGNVDEAEFYFTPTWLIPLCVVAAIRFGVVGAAATATLIGALAVCYLVRGVHPYATTNPQFAVWLTQEYLAVVAVVSVGLAIVLREIADQRVTLRQNERALQAHNLLLEDTVQSRTQALHDANQALEKANAQLAVAAATDELTGIANRRHLHQEAEKALHRLRQSGGTAALIMIDLDLFKKINDSYGHEAGDLVLREIQQPIRGALRANDLVGRMGGEEFLIFLPGVNLATAARIAERIRLAIESLEISYRGHSIHVTASLGLAQLEDHGDLDALIREADDALYRAKQNGRNRVECSAAGPGQRLKAGGSSTRLSST